MRYPVAVRSVGAVGVVASISTVAALALLILRGATHDWQTGDTKVLVAGLGAITRCVTDGVLCRGISKFPLLQQVPAYLLHLIGLSDSAILGAVVWLNVIVTLILIAATASWGYRRAGLPMAVISGLLMGCGMLLPYTAQTFAEPLGAAAFAGVVLTALRKDRTSRWLLVMALLATISKETAAPFVFLLGLAAFGLSGAPFAVVKRSAIHLAIGVAVGELLNIGFNLLRYGQIVNPVYLVEPRAPSAMWISNGVGMLVSPNAGITWFWPGVSIAVVLLVVTVVRPCAIGLDGRLIRAGAIAGLLVFAVMVVTLADWWAPFGWYAWGPRLLMPLGAGMVALGLPLIARVPLNKTRALLPGAIALAIVCGLTTLPNVAVVFRPGTAQAQITGTWKVMPYCQPGHTTGRTQAQQNQCEINNTWSTRTAPLKMSVSQASYFGSFWRIILFAWLAIILWVRLAYRTARDPAVRRGASSGSAEQSQVTDLHR